MREIRCRDLDESLASHQAQGFRLDTIIPADDPAELLLSRGDEQLRLVRDGAADAPDGDWHRGRAGMDYRDLVPDRRGGALIASHIRIEQSGPVADYVHYHDVRVQIIYCMRGWVRLVYEDQGDPFVMSAGDCVVQPPQIRHRVLECSAGLEVIEVASPAVHATHVDHDLALPTPRRERTYGGQRFAWCRAGELGGIAEATGGLASIAVAGGALAIEVVGHALRIPLEAPCGHLLCELIGGACSLATGRSRGCTAGFAAKTIAPEVFDEVRALVAVIDPVTRDERVRTAAARLAEIFRREARDDRNLLVHARSDEPDLAPALERLCMRRRSER